MAVSIPDELFGSAESLGKRMRVSRSRLYATALAEFLAKHQGQNVTDRLNQIYSAEDSRVDVRLERLQQRSVGADPW